MSQEKNEFAARLAALPEEQQNRLFELLWLPEKDYQRLMDYPRTYAFWLGVVAVLTALGGAVWALITLAPEKASDAARAAFGVHGS